MSQATQEKNKARMLDTLSYLQKQAGKAEQFRVARPLLCMVAAAIQ